MGYLLECSVHYFFIVTVLEKCVQLDSLFAFAPLVKDGPALIV